MLTIQDWRRVLVDAVCHEAVFDNGERTHWLVLHCNPAEDMRVYELTMTGPQAPTRERAIDECLGYLRMYVGDELADSISKVVRGPLLQGCARTSERVVLPLHCGAGPQ